MVWEPLYMLCHRKTCVVNWHYINTNSLNLCKCVFISASSHKSQNVWSKQFSKDTDTSHYGSVNAVHCRFYLSTEGKLPICWISPMTYYLTSKTLWAVTDHKMDSCLWTRACVSLWTEACQSNCRVWVTGLISLAFELLLLSACRLLHSDEHASLPGSLAILFDSTWTPDGHCIFMSAE